MYDLLNKSNPLLTNICHGIHLILPGEKLGIMASESNLYTRWQIFYDIMENLLMNTANVRFIFIKKINVMKYNFIKDD